MRADPFTGGLGDLQGPTHWTSLLPDDARLAGADLLGWVGSLGDRFGLATRGVPPCVSQHHPPA